MNMDTPKGFAGRILRVDLTKKVTWVETLGAEEWRESLGGVGIGAKVLYEEVSKDTHWDDPENRLVMATGPFAGLPVWGASGLTVCTRGAMTNGATSTQANGFFGTNLKYSGYDAVVFQGQSADWVYLYIRDDVVELRDAQSLLGKDTWETQQALEDISGFRGHQLSVYSCGVAGENLVRFAAIHGDYGHVASKNGCGAVMGSKRVKALAIVRGSRALPVHDAAGLMNVADKIGYELRTDASTKNLYELGTLSAVVGLQKLGALPIKNYTTNTWPVDADPKRWEGRALRDGFEHRGHQCSACGMKHCHQQVIAEGEHKGSIVDEPEYEGWSGCGWTIGCTNPQEVAWLNTQVDRAVVDVNEFGWVVGWVMECFEKGYITKEMLGGLEPRWGDIKAAYALLQMIVKREGFGDILAEGVKRAAEHLGGEAQKCAVYTMKGSSPRGHDHRGRWEEMLDTCTGSTGSLEAGQMVAPQELQLPMRINPFDATQVTQVVSGMLGRRHFEDSLGSCIFTTRTSLENLCNALNSATGWDYTVEEAMQFGRRTACLLRAFNVRCGITPEMERPSERYGSQPVDGPASGQNVMDHWENMVASWYERVGYDRKTGNPKPELLRSLGLDYVANDLWGEA